MATKHDSGLRRTDRGVALTSRRHIDFARVFSAGCR